MNISQATWTDTTGWNEITPGVDEPDLVLIFGEKSVLVDSACQDHLRQRYPGAVWVGCSTAGEICGTTVSDSTVVVTAVRFAHTQVLEASVRLDQTGDSFEAGRSLAQSIPATMPGKAEGASDPLAHVFVLSDGHDVNGSQLVTGLAGRLPSGVAVTGGLAGDGVAFGETVVFADRQLQSGVVTALGLYGRRLRVGFGSLGGWDSFGPERLITRATGNVLYELDGQSALGLYKKYLGEHADELPASGLLFPLSIRTGSATPLVRTILAVNEQEQSLIFAGDLPEGSYARLMRANFDRLIDGATGAAQSCTDPLVGGPAELAILISCVGRKLLLGQRVEEEVEGVAEVLGAGVPLIGFYSYGEISPFGVGQPCALHNQTMTITTLRET